MIYRCQDSLELMSIGELKEYFMDVQIDVNSKRTMTCSEAFYLDYLKNYIEKREAMLDLSVVVTQPINEVDDVNLE